MHTGILFTPIIHLIIETPDACKIENKILKTYSDKYVWDNKFNGSTEFRIMTDSSLNTCIKEIEN